MWHFQKIQGNSPGNRNEAEFFKNDAIDGLGNAVARESIQNALDAHDKQAGGPVRVSMQVVECDWIPELFESTRTDEKNEIEGSLWQHAQAKRSGLRKEDIPQAQSRCKFLIVEDFNTTGLTGNEFARLGVDDESNNFHTFFRTIGESDKEGKLGRWGIGKHTFWAASKLNTVFGFTITQDEPESTLKTLFMGRSILRIHALPPSTERAYDDGYYGSEWDPQHKTVAPYTGDDALNCAQLLPFTRQAGQKGLSIAVPFIQDEIEEDAIFKHILGDYFHQILLGQLVVTLNGEQCDQDNVEGYLHADATTKRLIKLGSNLRAAQDNGTLTELGPPPSKDVKWRKELFADDILREHAEAYRDKKEILLRIRVQCPEHVEGVHPAGDSYFDVAIAPPDGNEPTKAVFVRQQISIPEPGKRIKDNFALVMIEEPLLANLLSAGEDPGHTTWKSRDVTKKYPTSRELVSFVTGSVAEILKLLTGADEESDGESLSDIFGWPGKGDGKKGPKPPKDDAPAKCMVDDAPDGFKICPGRLPAEVGEFLDVKVAYGVRHKSALQKHRSSDFQLGSPSMTITAKGLSDVLVYPDQPNRITAKITDPQFELIVGGGFDGKRDVYAKPTVKKELSS